MKILMLPAWFPNRLELSRLGASNYAAVTSFFAEQADALYRHSGVCVDILMPKIYSVAKLPRLRSLPVWGIDINKREGGEDWIGYYPYLLPYSRPRNWAHFGEKLFSGYVKKHGMPDVLWSNGVLWSAFLANHLHHKYNLPYFVVEHQASQILDSGTKKSRKVKNEVIRIFQEALFNAAGCTHTARRVHNFIGDSIPDIYVVTNIIAKPFEQIDDALKEIPSGFVFHNTARMDDNKNQATIIAAFAKFCKTAPNARLNIVGEGERLPEIKRQIKELGLDNKVNLLGYMAREDLATQLLKSSAFVCASRSETFNITLIEALACGLPCISTAAGVAEEAINESNGIVIASGSSEDILKGMRYVYERYHSYNHTNIRNDALSRYNGMALAKQLQNHFNRTHGALAHSFQEKLRQ